MLNKNKQKMHYTLLLGKKPVYETNEDGSIKYLEIDGEMVPVETGETELDYSSPIPFTGNFNIVGGNANAETIGINVGEYESVLVMEKGAIPITEKSLIWHESKPKYDFNGSVVQSTADYVVIKVAPSINVDRYVLKKVVK